MSSFKDLKNLDIRLAKVLECKSIPNSKSLIELKADIGDNQTRTIIAAIKEWYSVEDLVDEYVLVALNLPLNSLESEGSLLAIDAEHSAVLLKPDKKYKDKIKPGMKLA